MRDDGTVVARTRLVRPMAREPSASSEFARSHWREATRDRSRRCGKPKRRVPEFAESEFHVITGLLLPIWDRLPADNMRVYRFETDDGERVIGRLVTPEALDRSTRGSASMGPCPIIKSGAGSSHQDAWSAVIDRGATLDLVGDLQVRRSLVMSAHRVELTGFSDSGLAS